jgi:2-keto-4-pentenoate hydratase
MATLQNPQLELLAQRLSAAQAEGGLIASPTVQQIPQNDGEAFAVQQRILELRGQPVAAWKVGSKSADGPIHGAPLPASGVLTSPARLPHNLAPAFGLELEVAFSFKRSFEPRAQPYDTAEVLAGIGSVMATMELVSSRLPNWPTSAKLAQLADLQNHLALVVGEAVPYRSDMVLEPVELTFEFEGRSVASGSCLNPAADPRRLFTWLVNHACACGLGIGPQQVVTAGSYTGLYFPETSGTALGEIQGLPPVRLTLF